MKRAFTLIETAVAVTIIAIAAVIIIPEIYDRINSAKWSEGQEMMRIIATRIRFYDAEVGPTASPPTSLWVGDSANNLGFERGAFDGTYFDDDNFKFTVSSMDPLQFTITAIATDGSGYTLNEKNTFTAQAQKQ